MADAVGVASELACRLTPIQRGAYGGTGWSGPTVAKASSSCGGVVLPLKNVAGRGPGLSSLGDPSVYLDRGGDVANLIKVHIRHHPGKNARLMPLHQDAKSGYGLHN